MGRQNWVYERGFVLPKEFSAARNSDRRVVLNFDGLDSVADVLLNDRNVGSADNMFVRQGRRNSLQDFLHCYFA